MSVCVFFLAFQDGKTNQPTDRPDPTERARELSYVCVSLSLSLSLCESAVCVCVCVEADIFLYCSSRGKQLSLKTFSSSSPSCHLNVRDLWLDCVVSTSVSLGVFLPSSAILYCGSESPSPQQVMAGCVVAS